MERLISALVRNVLDYIVGQAISENQARKEFAAAAEQRNVEIMRLKHELEEAKKAHVS